MTKTSGKFELAIEGLSAVLFGDIDPDGVHLAKTADRRIVGSMVEFAFLCRHIVDPSGGRARTDSPP